MLITLSKHASQVVNSFYEREIEITFTTLFLKSIQWIFFIFIDTGRKKAGRPRPP